jgi:hypothetical protein
MTRALRSVGADCPFAAFWRSVDECRDELTSMESKAGSKPEVQLVAGHGALTTPDEERTQKQNRKGPQREISEKEVLSRWVHAQAVGNGLISNYRRLYTTNYNALRPVAVPVFLICYGRSSGLGSRSCKSKIILAQL